METRYPVFSCTVLVALLCLSTFAVPEEFPIWYDVPEGMDPFNNPHPFIESEWFFGYEYLDRDKGVDRGYIPESYCGDSIQTSRGDGFNYQYWNNGPADTCIGGFSFNNSISEWLKPGAQKAIRYSIRQDYSGGGGPNNSDILEIRDDQTEKLFIHGERFEEPSGVVPPYNTLGISKSGSRWEPNLNMLDWKPDHDEIPMAWNFADTILHSTPKGKWCNVINDKANQSAENVYSVASKRGVFDTNGTLRYGVRPNTVWGATSGSGYSGLSDGSAFSAKFDCDGEVSGEKLGTGCYFDDDNNRWYGQVERDTFTYKLYLEDTDGSIKAYDPAKYPEDPANPFDPEAASGFPIRWHDDYELEATYGLDLGVDNYGQAGRWVAERSEYYYLDVPTAYAHAGDVMSETRSYDPYGNADGPESPYEWVYDANGNMYEPLDGSGDPKDGPEERAYKLIRKYNWAQVDGATNDPGTVPNEIQNWEYEGESEGRQIGIAGGTPPDSYFSWTAAYTGVLEEEHASALSPPVVPLPDGVAWKYSHYDSDLGKHIWITADKTTLETVAVTDWRASQYNWRTFESYISGGGHPAYPDDDECGEWAEWVYNATDGVWESQQVSRNDMEDDVNDKGNYDYLIGGNFNNGRVTAGYLEYAWKIAGIMLDDRFWEEDPDYFWSNNLGAVATREYFDDQLVELGGQFYTPMMTWNGVRWEFPTSPYSTNYVTLWTFMDHYADTKVEGHEVLNDFLRYVMDMDALVIQDVNGNGVFDIGEDYILFSLVDDGRFTKMLAWGEYSGTGIDTLFEGQYFDGDTIFLYDGANVETWFDPRTGIFFGESIGTTPGSTLWSISGIYDIDALDIYITEAVQNPEPLSILLMLGSLSGFALLAGARRRKLRSGRTNSTFTRT